jgi:hypothetical protein
MRIPFLLLGSLVCVGASHPPLQIHEVGFDPSELAWSVVDGSGSATGILTWKFGKEWPCDNVALLPKSKYVDEIYTKTYGNTDFVRLSANNIKGMFRSNDPGLIRFERRAQCDKDGRFRFANLPSGFYYVNSAFVGDIINRKIGRLKRAGQEYVLKRIEVKDGQETKIDLRDN